MKNLIFALVLCLAACSKKENTPGNTVPSPVNPAPAAPSTPVAPAPTTTPDPHAGNLVGSVAINLIDKVNFQGLADLTGESGIAGNIFLPLVGDPKINLKVTNSRSQTINGSLVLAFEDQQGFWEAQWERAFPGTATHITNSNGNSLEAIFADDALVVRTVGTITGDTLAGQIYYRLRQPGETACRQVQVTCEVIYPFGLPQYNNSLNNSLECNYPVPDTATPCRAYMNLTDTNVKKLGTFQTSYSAIATLPEGK